MANTRMKSIYCIRSERFGKTMVEDSQKGYRTCAQFQLTPFLFSPSSNAELFRAVTLLHAHTDEKPRYLFIVYLNACIEEESYVRYSRTMRIPEFYIEGENYIVTLTMRFQIEDHSFDETRTLTKNRKKTR